MSATVCLDLELAPLASQFATLKLESAGSPAPWTSSSSTSNDSLDGQDYSEEDPALRPQILIEALIALSGALAEQANTRPLLQDSLAAARLAHADLRFAVHRARDTVLSASKAAQVAHAEARRAQKTKSAFRAAADRIVAALDRRTIRALRKGKWRAIEDEGAVDVSDLVDDLVRRLDLDSPGDLHAAADEPDPDPTVVEAWLKIEDDLLETLAARILNRASPERRALRLLDLDTPVDETDTFTFPLSPTSPDSLSLPLDPETGALPLPPPHVDFSTLVDILRPVVHPVVAELARRHRQLQLKIDRAELAFQDRVVESTVAVDTHRSAVSKVHRAAIKIKNLEGLERRERQEEARLMEELRDTVVELAQIRRFGTSHLGELSLAALDERLGVIGGGSIT
ncbi:hypothetical protein BMF94_1146 [Rhodotorula taiwanensis]|uniref:Uncharacterized protein n=1 Tax=Rhodotorula taiwanensis TaxID=741276 RepID=A0A2S5BG34_9BASI|nr:hypothetical protein BMF94_1146 [Rhodotorula taiwanensis]